MVNSIPSKSDASTLIFRLAVSVSLLALNKYLPALIFYGTNDGSFNFGDAPYTISSGNQDPNGYGNFEYETEGFYALNSKNLAEFG